jgi:hypothetical protein
MMRAKTIESHVAQILVVELRAQNKREQALQDLYASNPKTVDLCAFCKLPEDGTKMWYCSDCPKGGCTRSEVCDAWKRKRVAKCSGCEEQMFLCSEPESFMKCTVCDFEMCAGCLDTCNKCNGTYCGNCQSDKHWAYCKMCVINKK